MEAAVAGLIGAGIGFASGMIGLGASMWRDHLNRIGDERKQRRQLALEMAIAEYNTTAEYAIHNNGVCRPFVAYLAYAIPAVDRLFSEDFKVEDVEKVFEGIRETVTKITGSMDERDAFIEPK